MIEVVNVDQFDICPLDEFTSTPSIENESLSLQLFNEAHVSVLKSNETEPFVNILVIDIPTSLEEACPLDLIEEFPDDPSLVSSAH